MGGHRPRVLLLIESAAPVPYWIAGVEHLAQSEFEPVLVTVTPVGPLHEHAHSLGVRSTALGVTAGRQYPAAVGRCFGLLRSFEIDLLHSCEAIPGAIGGAAASLARTPHVFHRQHGIVEAEGPAPRLLAWMATRLADMTMAVSPAIAELASTTRPEQPVCVAESGLPPFRPVDEREVRDLRSRLGIDQGDQVAVLVARLRAVKGHRDVLAGWQHVLDSTDDHVHLVFVGDGPEREALEAEVERLGLADVHFVGDQTDVSPWFALADVAIMPSRHEPFGLVALEAMMAERPLVASRVGGIAKIVEDGRTGLLVQPGDVRGFAEATVALLEDPQRRARISRAARERYEEHYTAGRMVDRWLDCYRRLLSAVGPNHR